MKNNVAFPFFVFKNDIKREIYDKEYSTLRYFHCMVLKSS